VSDPDEVRGHVRAVELALGEEDLETAEAACLEALSDIRRLKQEGAG
jgi:hypothetical protein